MTNWDDIRKEWETTKITFKDLAEKHDVKLGTLKSRRSREKWSRDATDKKDATLNKKMQPKNKVTARPKKEIDPIVESDELTDKQRLFCSYYVKYRNKTKAYMKAYGSSWETANAHAYRLWEIVGVREEIDRKLEELRDEAELDARDILQKYIDIAFADIGDYVERGEEGYSITVKPLDQMDTSIIGELSNTENGIKLKLTDKNKALDMLAKYTDLLSDKDKKRLEVEKLKAEVAKVKGDKKDTSMLETLVDSQKQFEELAKSGAFKQFEKGDSDD